jgi:4-amino-4-deoxy-L-arabinose transferase-like glycosyltransferase
VTASDGVPAQAFGKLTSAESAFLKRLMVYGFSLRVILALTLEWTGWSTRFAPDEQTYAETGWQIALYWMDEILIKPWWLSTKQPLGYFYLNGAFSYVFGATEIPIKIANALIGVVAGRYVYLLARELFGNAVARRASMLYVFFPSIVLWSALNIRDVWVILLVLLISWHSLQMVKGYSHWALFNIALFAWLLTLFRDYLFFVVALPPLVALLIGRRGHLGRNFLFAIATGVVLLVVLPHGGAGATGIERMSLESMSRTRQDMATGGSAFSRGVDISTPGKAIAFLPLGIAYFLFSPFPWQIDSVLKLFSLPEMFLLYALTPSILRGIRHAVRHYFRDALQILLLTALLTIAYSLGEGNVGTLYRHRAQAMPFYLIFAAVGRELRAARHPRTVAA